MPTAASRQAIGLRATHTQPVEHSSDVGPPQAVGAGSLPPPRVFTQVVRIAPLMTVAQISNGVAIFGTAGGRAVTP